MAVLRRSMMSASDSQELLRMQEEDSQVFENIITRIYSGILQRGDNCLDGGANNGLHTFPLARLVGPEGTVFAVEPVSSVANALEAALTSHRIDNVRIIRKALYHEHRTVQFKVVRNGLSRSGIERTWYPFEPDFEEFEVATILIDDILRAMESWRFCKLDLEGCEFRALQGGREALKRHSPFIVFERSAAATTWYRYTPHEFFCFFRDLSYEIFDLFGRRLSEQDWYASRRPWYALGVRPASEDAVFVHDRLPAILHDLLEAERSPVTNTSQRPTVDGPFIWAVPNPVPAGSHEGTTVVHWDTGDGSIGEVYISVNGDEERLFFKGAVGVRAAPWINAWGVYDFHLYRGVHRSELLGTVTVTRRKR